MVDRRSATASTAGVLRPEELARYVEIRRWPAGEAVAPWVENHWSLRWDLPEGRWFTSQVLTHPTCALTVELGSDPRPGLPPGETVVVTGVTTRRFDVPVRGWGRVLGVRFRPGGLAALVGGRARDWTDRVVPAREVLPPELCTALAAPELTADADAWTAAAEAGLLDLRPDRPDRRYERFLAVVADMLDDRTLVSVGEVAARHHTTLRTLQRMFADYVGVGPKWVLARYRMHDVVTELEAGYDGTLADLAHRYGWFDQAHFTREFTELVGTSPGRYRDAAQTSIGSRR